MSYLMNTTTPSTFAAFGRRRMAAPRARLFSLFTIIFSRILPPPPSF
jgi:hypothetical protein